MMTKKLKTNSEIYGSLNPEKTNWMDAEHYYLFHTQLYLYDCKDGKIVVNPYALCKCVYGKNGCKEVYFLGSKRYLPHAGVETLKGHMAEYVYDITDTVNLYGLPYVSTIISFLQIQDEKIGIKL